VRDGAAPELTIDARQTERLLGASHRVVMTPGPVSRTRDGGLGSEGDPAQTGVVSDRCEPSWHPYRDAASTRRGGRTRGRGPGSRHRRTSAPRAGGADARGACLPGESERSGAAHPGEGDHPPQCLQPVALTTAPLIRVARPRSVAEEQLTAREATLTNGERELVETKATGGGSGDCHAPLQCLIMGG
jgi:hypothetical protein